MGKIYFYKTDEPYGEFSNFSNHPIHLDGVYWATVEHYFQSNKFFNNHHMTVQLAKTPFEAAQLGRSRAFPIRPGWEVVKDEVMKKGVFKKIEMHASVRELLLGTGDLEIVEHTKNDFYWGDGGDGSGLNKLGKILMEARRHFSSPSIRDSAVWLMPPWKKFPQYDKFSIYWRMGHAQSYFEKWCDWFFSLEHEQKEKFKLENPAPPEWDDFYES